jgi:sulfur-carrier protein
MSVEISLPPTLQAMTGNMKQITCAGSTLGDCLNNLIEKFPQIKPKLFSSSGKLASGVNIFLNSTAILGENLSKPVKDGDLVYISFIVLGG